MAQLAGQNRTSVRYGMVLDTESNKNLTNHLRSRPPKLEFKLLTVGSRKFLGHIGRIFLLAIAVWAIKSGYG